MDVNNGDLIYNCDGLLGMKTTKGTTFGDRSSSHCTGSIAVFRGQWDDEGHLDVEEGICKILFCQKEAELLSLLVVQ